MKLHVGNPCFGCGKTLTEQDDIVVCPDCGTPYHRECWNKEKRCTNTALHASGESWQPVHTASEDEGICCPNCGKENVPEAKFCVQCGTSLQAVDRERLAEGTYETFQQRLEKRAEQLHFGDPLCGMDGEQEMEGERLQDVADFVKTNQRYYLPRFQLLSHGHKVTLNFPCLLFPQFYFAYRKMWVLSLVIIAVLTILGMPQMIMQLPDAIAATDGTEYEALFSTYPQFSQMLTQMQERIASYSTWMANLSTICTFLQICLRICFGIFGNWIYYRHVLKRVHQVKQENVSPEMRHFRMQQEGGTNVWLILATAGIGYIFEVVCLMILFAIFLF